MGNDSLDISQMAEGALTDRQRTLLSELPDGLQQWVRRYLCDSVRLSARHQLDYCLRAGTTDLMLNRVIESGRAALAHEAAIIRLVGAGAPLAMLASLGGLTKPDVTRLRRELGAEGRKAETALDGGDEAEVLHRWAQMGRPVTAQAFLHLYDTTGCPLSAIWALVNGALHSAHRRSVTGRRDVRETTYEEWKASRQADARQRAAPPVPARQQQAGWV